MKWAPAAPFAAIIAGGLLWLLVMRTAIRWRRKRRQRKDR